MEQSTKQVRNVPPRWSPLPIVVDQPCLGRPSTEGDVPEFVNVPAECASDSLKVQLTVFPPAPSVTSAHFKLENVGHPDGLPLPQPKWSGCRKNETTSPQFLALMAWNHALAVSTGLPFAGGPTFVADDPLPHPHNRQPLTVAMPRIFIVQVKGTKPQFSSTHHDMTKVLPGVRSGRCEDGAFSTLVCLKLRDCKRRPIHPAVGVIRGVIVRSILGGYRWRVSQRLDKSWRVLASHQTPKGTDASMSFGDQTAASASRSFVETRRTWGLGRRLPTFPDVRSRQRMRPGLPLNMRCPGSLGCLITEVRATMAINRRSGAPQTQWSLRHSYETFRAVTGETQLVCRECRPCEGGGAGSWRRQ
jgi:hypothetical protein